MHSNLNNNESNIKSYKENSASVSDIFEQIKKNLKRYHQQQMPLLNFLKIYQIPRI